MNQCRLVTLITNIEDERGEINIPNVRSNEAVDDNMNNESSLEKDRKSSHICTKEESIQKLENEVNELRHSFKDMFQKLNENMTETTRSGENKMMAASDPLIKIKVEMEQLKLEIRDMKSGSTLRK